MLKLSNCNASKDPQGAQPGLFTVFQVAAFLGFSLKTIRKKTTPLHRFNGFTNYRYVWVGPLIGGRPDHE